MNKTFCTLSVVSLIVAGCSEPERIEVAPEPSATYVQGENWFQCALGAESWGWGSTITADDVPDAELEIFSDYAVLVLNRPSEIDGAAQPAESQQEDTGEANAATEREPLLEPALTEIRFHDPRHCEVHPANPAPEPEPAVGDQYMAMAYGDESAVWSCEDLLEGQLAALMEGRETARGAIREKRGEQGCDLWTVREDVSEMTDDQSVFISTSSLNYLDRLGRYQSASLILRCQENTTSVFISYSARLGNDRNYDDPGKNLLIRLDDDGAQTEFWRSATSGEAVGLWRGNRAIPFIRRLAESRELRVRVSPDYGNRIDTVFYLNHLDEHLPALASACGWEYAPND